MDCKLSVLCDKINSSKNFFNGNHTQVLWSFCTPSDKSLKCGTSIFKDLQITKPIDGKNIDRLSFKCSAELRWIVLNFRIH